MKKGDVPRFKVAIPQQTDLHRQSISSRQKNTKHGVFVKNLPSSLTKTELESTFRLYGHIEEVRLPLRNPHTNKGYGFILFVSKEFAQKALDEMDGQEINGHKIIVQPYKSK